MKFVPVYSIYHDLKKSDIPDVIIFEIHVPDVITYIPDAKTCPLTPKDVKIL